MVGVLFNAIINIAGSLSDGRIGKTAFDELANGNRKQGFTESEIAYQGTKCVLYNIDFIEDLQI